MYLANSQISRYRCLLQGSVEIIWVKSGWPHVVDIQVQVEMYLFGLGWLAAHGFTHFPGGDVHCTMYRVIVGLGYVVDVHLQVEMYV